MTLHVYNYNLSLPLTLSFYVHPVGEIFNILVRTYCEEIFCYQRHFDNVKLVNVLWERSLVTHDIMMTLHLRMRCGTDPSLPMTC